jgi:ketosteroid isomerase-like protein
LKILRFAREPLVRLSKLRGRKLVLACSAIAVVLIVLVTVLKPSSDKEQEVRDTLDRFAAATRDKDYQTLCDDLYASALVERIRAAGLPCEVALRTGLEDRQNPQLRVLAVELTGDTANARVRSTAAGEVASTDTVTLVKEGDDWKVSSLSDAGTAQP